MASPSVHSCPHCGAPLSETGGLLLCVRCNDAAGGYYEALSASLADFSLQSDKVLIECPGATLYLPGSDDVVAGVRFFDNNNPALGFEIIKEPLFGPAHVKHRWIKREDTHLIRRCQSCQDYTIRMRRKEGPDLYIPSRKSSHYYHARRHCSQPSSFGD